MEARVVRAVRSITGSRAFTTATAAGSAALVVGPGGGRSGSTFEVRRSIVVGSGS